MAHEIYRDVNTGKDAFAYVGEAAWHGLGQRLEEDAPLEVWEKEAGFNFKIKSNVAKTKDEESGEEILMPERKLLYRDDTLFPLSIVGSRYNVVQPKEILEFYRDLVNKAGFKMETAGVLFNGKRFWAMARIMEEAQFIVPADAVGGYLLLSTSCDGSLATSAQFTSVRVVCNNTLGMAVGEGREKGSRVKVPHSSKFRPEEVKNLLGLGQDTYHSFIADMRRLAATPLTTGEALTALKEIVGDPNSPYEAQEPAAFKRIGELYHLYNGGAKGAELAGKTSWGVLNAITEYCDHHTRHHTDSARMNSAWFGDNARLKTAAAEHLLEHFCN